jgi:large subunit ribosomal protein L28
MAKSDITGKRRLLAQNVSHSNIKTKRWQHINVQSRRVFVPELGRFVRLNVTTRDLRTIDKIGLVAYAKRHGVTILGACPPPRSRIAASLFTPSPVASSTGPGAFCVCTSENASRAVRISGEVGVFRAQA